MTALHTAKKAEVTQLHSISILFKNTLFIPKGKFIILFNDLNQSQGHPEG